MPKRALCIDAYSTATDLAARASVARARRSAATFPINAGLVHELSE
jgi:hypothetical protein